MYNLHVLDLKNKNLNRLALQTVYFRETVTSAKQLSGIRLCSAIPSGVVDWLTYWSMCHDYVICEEDCHIYRERTFWIMIVLEKPGHKTVLSILIWELNRVFISSLKPVWWSYYSFSLKTEFSSALYLIDTCELIKNMAPALVEFI